VRWGTDFAGRLRDLSNIKKGLEGKRDKSVPCTSAVEKLDFKKLGIAASLRIDFEDGNVRRR